MCNNYSQCFQTNITAGAVSGRCSNPTFVSFLLFFFWSVRAQTFAQNCKTNAPNSTLSWTHTDLTSFHLPASPITNSYMPYEYPLYSPLLHSPLPSVSSPLFAHRSYYSFLTSTASTSTVPTITPVQYAAVHHLAIRTMPPLSVGHHFPSHHVRPGVDALKPKGIYELVIEYVPPFTQHLPLSCVFTETTI